MKLTAGRGMAIGGVAAAASIALLMNGADAHHPEVSVSATCVDGTASVRIDSMSWITDNPDHRYNPNIAIRFAGTVIGSGAYTGANSYQFSLLYSHASDGGTYTVRATAVAPFGPSGEYGGVGEFRETTVTLPNNCVPPTTTAPPTTVPPAPTTTVNVGGAGEGNTPTTTVPVVVAGEVETRNPAAIPVEVIPRFAG